MNVSLVSQLRRRCWSAVATACRSMRTFICQSGSRHLLALQDVDWEFAEEAADDDLEQGASDEEGLDDDPGYRKELGEQQRQH